MPDNRCNRYELNQSFLDALEFMDDIIRDRSHMQRRIFVDLIPRGAYPLGEGLVRKQHFFQGGLGDQAALANWSTSSTRSITLCGSFALTASGPREDRRLRCVRQTASRRRLSLRDTFSS